MLSVKELIDTLWNVNTLEFTMPFDIMECKSDSQTKSAATTAAN